jgi:hypothetical protein
MKTTRILALLLFVSISIFVIISCQKNDLAKGDTSENVSGKAPVNNTILESIPSIPLPDCNTECINPDGPYIESVGSQTEEWGNISHPHSKTVSYVVYNTATSFVVKVTFVHSGGNASDLIRVTALGLPQSVETLASGATATFTFPLPSDWEKCDNVPFTIRQEGQSAPINMSASYNLYGICANRGCETSFTGEAKDCGTHRVAEYTFTSEEAITGFKIQGGLTNFTGENADVTVTHGSNITKTQWTPGGSSNRIIKVEGDIDACETIKICIKWNSTNSGGVITGSWSVSANGTEVAPAVAGLTCN